MDTTRYFDKNALRQLFTLGEPGKCAVIEMIDGFGIRFDTRPYESIMRHRSTLGMSRHDAFYDEIKQQVASEQVQPPRVLGRSQRVLQTNKNNNSALSSDDIVQLGGGRKAKTTDIEISSSSDDDDRSPVGGKENVRRRRANSVVEIVDSSDDDCDLFGPPTGRAKVDSNDSKCSDRNDNDSAAEIQHANETESSNSVYSDDPKINKIVSILTKRADELLAMARGEESLNILIDILEHYLSDLTHTALRNLHQKIAIQSHRLKLFPKQKQQSAASSAEFLS